MNLMNEVRASIDLSDLSTFMRVLLQIPEAAFLSIPVRDITNVYCWLATLLPLSSDIHSSNNTGIHFLNHSFSYENVDLNVSCVSCTSPKFVDLISHFYSLDSDETFESIQERASLAFLDAEVIWSLLSSVGKDASSLCPHSSNYQPSAATSPEGLWSDFTSKEWEVPDFTDRDQQSSLFNIASSIFTGAMLLLFVAVKLIIHWRNKQWKNTLSDEGAALLKEQELMEKKHEEFMNQHTTSLFQCPFIPRGVRFLAPLVIVANIGLFLVAHFGVLSRIDLDIQFAGETFTIEKMHEFTFISTTTTMYDTGGTEVAILLWIFAGIWPYLKCILSLFLWFVPPQWLSASNRGRLLLWIDALTKLSIIDILVVVLLVAFLFVYLGGPAIKSSNSDNGELYNMIVIGKFIWSFL